MVENKLFRQIMREYRELILRHEICDSLSEEEIKMIVFEVKVFWQKRKKIVEYILNQVDREDEVAFLAGAIRLDIENMGHFDFCLVGKTRIVSDPIYKMSHFYFANAKDVNKNYINEYFRDCIIDLSIMLKEYSEDFYVLPLEVFSLNKNNENNKVLDEMCDMFIKAMFKDTDLNIVDYFSSNQTFEEIEYDLRDSISEMLIFDSFCDRGLELREKVKRYLDNNSEKIPIYNSMSEAQQFYMIVSQFVMQALSIIIIMVEYNMIPYIRDEVTYQFFSIMCSSNIIENESEVILIDTHIAFILHRFLNYEEMEYSNVKSNYGNGKLIRHIKSGIDYPMTPERIMNEVKKYKCITARY